MPNEPEEHEPLPAELAEFAQQLAGLAPAPSSFDRERLMYLAGRASVAPPNKTVVRLPAWAWPLSTAALLLVAFWLGGQMASGPTKLAPQEQIAQQPAPQTHLPAAPLPAAPQLESSVPFEPFEMPMPPRLGRGAYLELRQLVLSQGVDALPSPAAAHRRPNDGSRQELLDELLGG